MCNDVRWKVGDNIIYSCTRYCFGHVKVFVPDLGQGTKLCIYVMPVSKLITEADFNALTKNDVC